jgi:hypothetical protein
MRSFFTNIISWAKLQTNEAKWAVFYFIILAAHIALIWALPYFPTQDGPSHIYNLTILYDLAHGGASWGQYFSQQRTVAPNLGFIAISYYLLAIFHPLVAEKIFITIYAVSTGMAVPLLIKKAGANCFPVAFLLFPMLYCYPVMMGFYSYIIGIPLLVAALVIYWTLHKRRFLTLFVVANLLGIILCFCHLLIFLMFLLAIFALILVEAQEIRRLPKMIASATIITVVPIVEVVLYVFSLVRKNGPVAASTPARQSFANEVQNLSLLSIDAFSRWQAGCGLLLSGILIILLARNICQSKYLKTLSIYEKWMLCVAAFSFLLYFFIPDNIGNHGLIKLRIPIFIVIFLLPALGRLSFSKETRALTISVICVSLLCVCVNFWFIRIEAGKVSDFMSGIAAITPSDSFAVTYKGNNSDHRRVDAIKHAIAYYGIEKGYIDVGNYEPTTGHFYTAYKDNAPPMPPVGIIQEVPQAIAWSTYDSIKYVFGWRQTEKDRTILQRYYKPVWQFKDLIIWERQSQTSTEAP